jgi:5-methylcytosine-specific restriction endonuclease McrA
VRRNDRSGALQRELEHRIQTGRCVYCRAPAAPDRPLTREHVIPRSKGGRRRDTRIIVPACARCNQRRGCQEVVLFLLARPGRIAAFLDYLHTLPPDTVRELDVRVFAELYAAVWLLGDSAEFGDDWRERLRHLCSGRRLHRRRYAARRIVSAVGVRLERARDRAPHGQGPGCPLPPPRAAGESAGGSLEQTLATLVGALSMLWDVPAERVAEELAKERSRSAVRNRDLLAVEDEGPGVVSLDGWRRRGGRRRKPRVDQRGGRGVRGGGRPPRGRAA